MTLYEGTMNEEYQLTGMYMNEEILRRLEALGMNDGTRVTVLNRKKHGAMIIKVRGTRLALGRKLAQQIEVESYGE
ncbi:MAG: ferrous iron transport protein A [Lachnospiraceae bacterium]